MNLISHHLGPCRLSRGPAAKKNAQIYLQRARIRIVHHAAAVAWSNGVPWATALDLSKKAIATADGTPKALPKKRPRRVWQIEIKSAWKIWKLPRLQRVGDKGFGSNFPFAKGFNLMTELQISFHDYEKHVPLASANYSSQWGLHIKFFCRTILKNRRQTVIIDLRRPTYTDSHSPAVFSKWIKKVEPCPLFVLKISSGHHSKWHLSSLDLVPQIAIFSNFALPCVP